MLKDCMCGKYLEDILDIWKATDEPDRIARRNNKN
jgi:hypothetical protein